MDDYAVIFYKDYVIQGETFFYLDELEAWGARINPGMQSWVLTCTNPTCSDYQAIQEMGLDLLPMQISGESKLLRMQLKSANTLGDQSER
tara:strand:+ start:30111 stop:30380 length:270 start_codon:yes stop_codon:yes gene_type:complete